VSTFAGVIDAEQTEEGGKDEECAAGDVISSRELGDPGEGNEETQAGEMKVSGGGEPSGSTRCLVLTLSSHVVAHLAPSERLRRFDGGLYPFNRRCLPHGEAGGDEHRASHLDQRHRSQEFSAIQDGDDRHWNGDEAKATSGCLITSR